MAHAAGDGVDPSCNRGGAAVSHEHFDEAVVFRQGAGRLEVVQALGRVLDLPLSELDGSDAGFVGDIGGGEGSVR